MTDETVRGVKAFEDVLGALSGDISGAELEFPYRRLKAALRAKTPSQADVLVLLRQVLRHHEASVTCSPVAMVPANTGWLRGPCDPRDYGLREHRVGNQVQLMAQPWRPAWLAGVPSDGVDGPAGRTDTRRHRGAAPTVDPFLPGLGHDRYQSPAQAAAVRAVLSAPSGSSLGVVLPTGEGKSLTFHAVAKTGYANSPRGYGTTLVVTPTVSLALDHERSSSLYAYRPGPLAYRGGADETNALIRDRIRSGEQQIVFAAPEAMNGPLLGALIQSATSGMLRAIFVDEAHLVDTWGDIFRPDFQLMAGVRQQLVDAAPPGEQPRTVLLTATLTDWSASVLRRLFGAEGGRILHVSASPVLRPEFDYWTPGLVPSREERDAFVEECLRQLPRPAILYVTERKDAERWFARLTQLGYARLGMMTGDSSTSDREALIRDWRDGSVDLVVGTSAFGLGIDNPDVRAIIHACLPEGLDRFYQEVGRAGRDGRAAVSVLLPTPYDEGIGKSLTERRLISVERGYQRWVSMHQTARPTERADVDQITVRVDLPPSMEPGDINMDSDQNRDWHVRTLTMMALSGIVRLSGCASDRWSEDGRERVPVTVDDRELLHGDRWASLVGRHRTAAAQAGERSFSLLGSVLSGHMCVGSALAQQYALSGEGLVPPVAVNIEPVCFGCRSCRADGAPVSKAAEPMVGSFPWEPPDVSPELRKELDHENRLVVLFPDGRLATEPGRRRLYRLLAELAAAGVRRVRWDPSLGLSAEDFGRVLDGQTCFLAENVRVPGGLPPGAIATVLAGSPRTVHLALGARLSPWLLFAPDTPASAAALSRYAGLVVQLPDLEMRWLGQ